MTAGNEPLWAATPEKLEEAVRRLVEAARPAKVILFGSRARGNADNTSDIDLLVIEDEVEDRFSEMIRLNGALRGLILAVDLLVIGKREFELWSQAPGSVYYAARREGKVLYEAA